MHQALLLTIVVGFHPSPLAAHDDPLHHHGGALGEQHAATMAFYEARVAQEPEDLTAWSKLAPLYLEAGKAIGSHELLRQAEQAFEKVLQGKPRSEEAYAGIAYARLGRHAFDAAERAAREQARRQPDSPATMALLGDVAFARGDYAQAGWAYRALSEADPGLASSARLGLIHQERGRVDQARAAFEDALQQGIEASLPAIDLAWCRAMLGELEWEQGHTALAEQHFLQALEEDPHGRAAILGLVECWLAKNQADRALPMLQALVHRNPEAQHAFLFARALEATGEKEGARGWRVRAEREMLEELAAGDMGHLRVLMTHWFESQEPHPRELELALRELDVRRDLRGLYIAAWAHHRAGNWQRAYALVQEAQVWGGATSLERERAAIMQEAWRTHRVAALLQLTEAEQPAPPAPKAYKK